MNIVNKMEPSDYVQNKTIVDSILDVKESQELVHEIEIFSQRAKSLVNKYYEDIYTIDRLNGLEKKEVFLALKQSPKKLEKYFKYLHEFNHEKTTQNAA